MPVFQDVASIYDLTPYFGLTDALYPHILEVEFRNILFLGWGADFEKEFLNDCDFDPTGLKNIVVRLLPVQQTLSYLHIPSTSLDQTCLISGGAVAKGFVILPVFKSCHRTISTWAVSLTDLANGSINYPKHLRMDSNIEKQGTKSKDHDNIALDKMSSSFDNKREKRI